MDRLIGEILKIDFRSYFLQDIAWSRDAAQKSGLFGGCRPDPGFLPCDLVVSFCSDHPLMPSSGGLIHIYAEAARHGLNTLLDICRLNGSTLKKLVIACPGPVTDSGTDKTLESETALRLFSVPPETQISLLTINPTYPFGHPSAVLRAFRNEGPSQELTLPAPPDIWFARFQDLAALGLSISEKSPVRIIAVSCGSSVAFSEVPQAATLAEAVAIAGVKPEKPAEFLYIPDGPYFGSPAEPSRAVGPDLAHLCLMNPPSRKLFRWLLRPFSDREPCFSSSRTGNDPLEAGDAGETRPCIGCLRCAAICPAGISPVAIVRSSPEGSFRVFDAPKATAGCLACRLCSWVCPSKLDVAHEVFASRVPGPGQPGLQADEPICITLRPWTLDPIREAAATFFRNPGIVPSKGPMMRSGQSVKTIMSDVIVALLPVLAFSIWLFGPRVLVMVAVSYAVGGAIETLSAIARGEKIQEGFLVTGLILPLTLPPMIPLHLVAAGITFSVVIGKEFFGGTGRNPFNPALSGRCFLMIGFPLAFSGSWVNPGTGFWSRLWESDALTSATPLGIKIQTAVGWSLTDLFFGTVPGSAGETSALLILLGGLFLIGRKTTDFRTPLSVVAGFSVAWSMGYWSAGPGLVAESVPDIGMSVIGATGDYSPFPDLVRQIFSGGLLFGAFFMATDPVTSAHTNSGRIFCGAVAGAAAALIRMADTYPEGVMFGILLSNAIAPLADKLVTAFSVPPAAQFIRETIPATRISPSGKGEDQR